MDVESLQAQNAELRQQIEAHRQHELASLQEQLVAARADAIHYRAEAERNASIGRQIHLEAQGEISRLREKVAALERTPNARIRPGEFA